MPLQSTEEDMYGVFAATEEYMSRLVDLCIATDSFHHDVV